MIALGAVWILRSIGMVPMVFGTSTGALAATGHHFFAVWHEGAIGGAAYFVHVVASPELWSSCSS